jgi:hypothetical protein
MKLTPNSKGLEHLLKVEARPLVEKIAANIADAAGEGMEYDVQIGRSRARGLVWTGTGAAMRAEAESRALTRAIDAGRL